jgi:Na+-translocating ferredoxin:NAD+ oxidoreductase RnfG subunit
MKDNPLYAFIFIVVLCALCASVLTFASTLWSARIEANENYARIEALVHALGLAPLEAERQAVLDAYAQGVTEQKRGVLHLYVGKKDGKPAGEALQVVGRGKYGLIKGMLAFAADRGTIQALRIYEQNETPGIGGRIQSEAWLGQFSGLPIGHEGKVGIIIGKRGKGAAPNVVDAVTGASKTMRSMERIINQAIAQYLAGGADVAALDLGLTPDAISKSTPGYPKHLVKPPHVRKEVRRADFMVPRGLKNLARNKPVTCSEEDGPLDGELEQVTDGDKKSGQFHYVELGPDPQWVQIDLGAVREIHAVVIWHYYTNAIIYNDVICQVADDAEFTQNMRTLFNNDHDDSSEQGKGADTAYWARWWGEIVDARGKDKKGTKTRYVRVWTNGGAGEEDTRFVEIEVYGR